MDTIRDLVAARGAQPAGNENMPIETNDSGLLVIRVAIRVKVGSFPDRTSEIGTQMSNFDRKLIRCRRILTEIVFSDLTFENESPPCCHENIDQIT